MASSISIPNQSPYKHLKKQESGSEMSNYSMLRKTNYMERIKEVKDENNMNDSKASPQTLLEVPIGKVKAKSRQGSKSGSKSNLFYVITLLFRA